MHPGIWFGVGDLSGADFWRNKATVEHIRFVSEARGGEDAGEFTVLNRYVHNGNPLAEEPDCAYAPRAWDAAAEAG